MSFNYKLERYMSLDKYYFRNKETFIEFFKEIDVLYNKQSENMKKTSYNIEILNDFGKVFITDVKEFEEQVMASKNIYSVKISIDSEEIELDACLMEFETLKEKSHIKISGSNREMILEVEQKLSSIFKKHKNIFSFIHNSLLETFAYIVITIILFFKVKIHELNSSLHEFYIIEILLIIPIALLVFIIIKIIQSLFVPTFKLNTKTNVFRKIEVLYEKKKESLGFKILVFLFQLFLASILSRILEKYF